MCVGNRNKNTPAPPNLGVFQLNALAASVWFIVPIQANSYHALTGLEFLMETTGLVREDANEDLKFLRCLMTPTPGKLQRQLPKAFRPFRIAILCFYIRLQEQTSITSQPDAI